MKKSYLFSAFAAGMVMLSACSNDGDLTGGDESNDAVQEIVLQVANAGDGLQTRAGRPLYSSEALQTIQNVRVLVYKNDAPAEGGAEPAKTIVLDKKLNWTDSKTYENANNGDHGRQLTIFLKGKDKLTEGKYKIMAVGYSNNSDYTYSLDVKNAEEGTLAGDGKVYSDITATLNANTPAEEVFAGEAEIKINDKQEVLNNTKGENGVAVTLHRQVAGGLGYFTNIPAKVDGAKARYLRLVMRDANDVVTFNNFNSSFISNNGENSLLKYVVNGSKSSETSITKDASFKGENANTAYTLYTIDLNEWFPNGDANKDGLLSYEDCKGEGNEVNWKHPKDVRTTVVKGSVFAGRFIVPFKLKSKMNTMELQLLDEKNNIIMIWNVTIPSTDVNNDKTKGEVDESNSVFNVVRNHMYNLGIKKVQGGNPDPGNPDPKPDPDPDPDPKPNPDPDHKPEDLSKGQNLILKVNDNWEAIHQLIID